MHKTMILAALAPAIMSMAFAVSAADCGYRYAKDSPEVRALVGVTNMPPENALYRDPAAPVEARIADLMRYLEPREMFAVSTMTGFQNMGAVPRIGLAEYRTPDGPEGIRTRPELKQPVTYFPAAIAYAAAWDSELSQEIGRVFGEETRGHFKGDNHPARMLLAPGVNIARTPLCGRAQEYLGEDPVLAGKTAAAICRGLQSVKVSPCIKHYLLNDQDWCRTVIDIEAPERAIREIYARPFEIAVREADVWSLMSSYNAVRGTFASANRPLLKMLYEDFGFTGNVFADWGAFADPKVCYNAGTTVWTDRARDWKVIDNEVKAWQAGAYDRAVIEENVRRNLRNAFRIGAFDTWTEADKALQRRCEASMGSDEHVAIARRTAEESFVLLKNADGFLPLSRDKVRKVALVGPGADQHYSRIDGATLVQATIFPFADTTVLEAFVEAFGKENVLFAPGFRYELHNRPTVPGMVERDPVAAAREADLVVFCGGTDHSYDSEHCGWGYVPNADKPGLNLKGPQAELIRRVAKANPNIVVALNIASPVSVEPWDADVKGILVTWYSGQTGARTLRDMIFGKVNPSGRLPYTFGRRLEDWPSIRMGELSYPGVMTNMVAKVPPFGILAKASYLDGIWVGYRGFEHFGTEPKYPFGFGLSYTEFKMHEGREPYSVDVTNVGKRDGRCVVQCYVAKPNQADAEMPVKELVDFASVSLKAGETRTLAFKPDATWFRYWSERENGWRKACGPCKLLFGFSSQDIAVETKVK